MPYELSNRLVIGLASSALFNLEKSEFRNEGEEKYRKHQREKQNTPLEQSIGLSFYIKKGAVLDND